MEQQTSLTDKEYWNEYWEEFPAEQHKSPSPIVQSNRFMEICDHVFDGCMSKGDSIIEIGGAPGLFVEYLGRRFDSPKLGILDFSEIGVGRANNFFAEHAKKEFHVHHCDLFKGYDDEEKYDIVYSLGFVEHFEDVEQTVDRHFDLAAPGGKVVIGLPVYLGINKLLVSIFAPKNQATWYDWIMDFGNWKFLDQRKDLKVVSKEYLGGFNPDVHFRLENDKNFFKKFLFVSYQYFIRRPANYFGILKNKNSKKWSYYAFIVLEKA